jgi:nucleoside-diphosphate-sugar epimerase
MRIAIFGATSQIAKDLILSFNLHSNHDLVLYARRPDVVYEWLKTVGLADKYEASDFSSFGMDEYFDAIINFVGVGDPVKAVAMGATIFEITLKHDEIALRYLGQHPDCRYIFLSSGAVYGSNFADPANEDTPSVININSLLPQDWYSVAKLHAECRHRSLSVQSIIDLRVFNYFSSTQDVGGNFLIAEIFRSIRDREVFRTSPLNIRRDYISPSDFWRLINAILISQPQNQVIDCYSKLPIDKNSLLVAMKSRFGLAYEFVDGPVGVNATGLKMNYYSENRRAADFGYQPEMTSLDGLTKEIVSLLN